MAQGDFRQEGFIPIPPGGALRGPSQVRGHIIARWLKAPVQMPDGTRVIREKGTPQGGVLTPPTFVQTCFSGLGSAGYGSIRTTMVTWSWATSTRCTKVRIMVRFLIQSAAATPAWTVLATSSKRPMISGPAVCRAAASGSGWP
jgi:hypothetical protein